MKQADDINYLLYKDLVNTPAQKYDVESNFRKGFYLDLLSQAAEYWNGLYNFRSRRKRARKYYRGQQWSDYIRNPETGELMTEENYIIAQGKIPFKQNQIRQLVKNMIGQYLSNPTNTLVIARKNQDGNASDMMGAAIRYVHQTNQTKSLDARCYEEFMISGAVCQKSKYSWQVDLDREDVLEKNINMNRVFFNTDLEDVRLKELRLIGEIIDTTIDNIVAMFATSPAQEERVRAIYGMSKERTRTYLIEQGLLSREQDLIDFYIPHDPNKCRLFEIWTLEGSWRTEVHDTSDGSLTVTDYTMKEIEGFNKQRIAKAIQLGAIDKNDPHPETKVPMLRAREKYDQYWVVRYLTPWGHCLKEARSPYAHKQHPYTLLLYPLLDGEVWGFVEDIIDQQRYINRLIILLDFIMSASAKGVLMIPEGSIPEGMTEDDFAEAWVKFNGVITYRPDPKTQAKPEQIAVNSTNVGINEMLALQMQLIQEISGVHSAIQGKSPKSGTPSSLYAQEAQNATVNTLDYAVAFNQFKQNRDRKVMKLIMQYYRDKRYLALVGNEYKEDVKMFDPSKINNVEFDLIVTQGNDTPAYKQIIEDRLTELLSGGLIDLPTYLEHSTMPYAEKLLSTINQAKEQAAQGQIPGPVDPALMKQSQQQANPVAMGLLNKALGARKAA